MSIKDYVFRKGAMKRIPVSGTFELTSRCNLNCKMCYVHMTPEEQAALGSEPTTEEWIALGKAAVEKGMIYLLITGGEPMLRPDFAEIYTALIQMGLLVSINTNGTLITPEIVEVFKKYRPEKVNVTLYGMSDATYGHLCGNAGGYRKVLQGIQMLREAQIRVGISATFTNHNIGDMEEIISYAKKWKLPVRMSSYIFPPVRNEQIVHEGNLSPEELGRAAAKFDLMTLDEEKAESRKEYIRKCLDMEYLDKKLVTEGSKISSCMAGRGAFWISWHGQLYPCGMLPDYIQDVRKVSFAEAWEKTCESIKTLYLPAECSVCKYQPLCPMCAAVSTSYGDGGKEMVADICVRTQAYVEEFLKDSTQIQ